MAILQIAFYGTQIQLFTSISDLCALTRSRVSQWIRMQDLAVVELGFRAGEEDVRGSNL